MDLYSLIYADLSIYARIYAKLKTFITRRGYVRFRWNLVEIDPRNEAHLLHAKLTEVVVIFVKFIFVLVQNKVVVIFVAPHMTA